MKPNEERIVKALETLDKMDFFQGQRAGRELWFDKPFEVQEKDLAEFSQSIVFLKNIIEDAQALILELTEEVATAKADTVRKMQERLKEETECVGECTTDNVLTEMYSVVREDVIDQIAKELLEEAK